MDIFSEGENIYMKTSHRKKFIILKEIFHSSKAIDLEKKLLRWISLKVRAISAKIKLFTKNLFQTSHFNSNSFLWVTPRLNIQAFSRKLMSNVVRMVNGCVIVFLTNAKRPI